jgi:hypothetical protein
MFRSRHTLPLGGPPSSKPWLTTMRVLLRSTRSVKTPDRAMPRALCCTPRSIPAWAKTRWTNLGDYGLNDRLRFLWHWGASQGYILSEVEGYILSERPALSLSKGLP